MFDPKRRRERGWAILAFALVCSIAGHVQDASARAMIKAPNYGGEVVSGPLPPEVTRVLRAEVGPPSAILEAWVVDPPRPARATVLLLHPEREDKRSLLALARSLAASDVRAIAVDLRGHGGSSGRWLTYGVVESRDLSQLIDQLEAVGVVEGPLGVYGVSYGAGVALQLSAIEPRVSAVVANATMTSFREAIPSYAERELPGLGALLPTALIDALVSSAGEMGGFSPEAADVRRAVARSRARVLFLHGESDRMVPLVRVESVMSTCEPTRCAIATFADLDHHETIRSADVQQAALRFLVQALATPPSAGGEHDRSAVDTWE